MAVRIGAHITGGTPNIVANARAIGADALQIFASNPRGWATPREDPALTTRVRDEFQASGLGPLFLHAPYLVNVASPDDGFLARSRSSLAWTIGRAESLGAEGVVVHAGSAGALGRAEGIKRFRDSIRIALQAARETLVLIELTAGGAGTLAARWPEAAELLDAAGEHQNIRFCFDTCHAFSAGYDLSTPRGMRACLREMEREIGRARLALIHANDSKDPCGSKRDRHWHIGEGEIGLEPFRALVGHPIARAVPLIVETPGGLQKHAENIARLRALAGTRR